MRLFSTPLIWASILSINSYKTALSQGASSSSLEENSVEYYQKKYPTEAGVVLNHTQTIVISVNKKTGELEILETDYEEILYLKESSKYYNEQSITTSDFFEDIVEISATTINPDGKKLKLKKDAFYKVDAERDSWVFHDENKEINFDLIDLGIGYKSIISYTKKIKKPEFFDVFHFISGFPTQYTEINITYPSDMEIAFYERVFGTYAIKKDETITSKGLKQIIWTMKDVPAYHTEDGSINTRHCIPHVVAQINSYKVNGQTKTVIADLKGLHSYFQEFLLAKGDESNRRELNTEVRKMIKTKETELEKMDTIFKWVQDNIKYIAFEDGINGYVPRSCSEVMKNRFGDCKDMGNLLVEMLTFAGVQGAHVAWVGTRDIPYLMGEIPVPFACNHVICVVDKPEGGYYYLDATNSEGSYNYPPSMIQNKDLLIHLGQDEFLLHNVAAVDAKNNYFKTEISYTYVPGDSLYATGIDYYGGYEREDRAYYILNTNREDRWDYIRDLTLNSENKFVLKDYTLDNLNNKDAELRINYTFSGSGILIPYNENFIFNPCLFKPRLSRYNDEEHTYPRNKDHHRTVDYIYHFTIPEGFAINSIPKDMKYENEQFQYSSKHEINDGVLTAHHTYSYSLLEIKPEIYAQWNEFSKTIQSCTDQNVILEKIQ